MENRLNVNKNQDRTLDPIRKGVIEKSIHCTHAHNQALFKNSNTT